MKKSKLAGAIAFSLLSLNVHALSVGNMSVSSYLGQPLDLSIAVSSIDSTEYDTLKVSLASREMFKKAQILYPKNAENLNIELTPYDNGRANIRVRTRGAVTDPFVDLLLNITWSGGNILREYTALLDPVDYKVSPVAQAAAPATKLGVSKPAGTDSQDDLYYTVQSGDSLSSIAKRYLPDGVADQQAWIAFYKLNPDAFYKGNINYIRKGARLSIPSEEEMRAVPRAEAVSEVNKVSQPLAPVTRETPVAEEPSEAKATPTLVVGSSAELEEKPEAPVAEEEKTPPVSAPVISAQEISGGAGKDSPEVDALVDKLNSFTQSIEQEVSGARERDVLFKEELIAARGENRELSKRLADLEAQIARMTQLLELQSKALQQINTDGAAPQQEGAQIAEVKAALEKLEKAAPEAEAPAAPVAGAGTQEQTQKGEPKSYYDQLMEEALTKAPEEDKSYIDQVIGESSTSIGQADTNPVTPEMKAKAAAEKPAAVPGGDQSTESMLAHVRESLGQLQGEEAGKTTVKTPLGDVQVSAKDQAYLEALNEEDRSEIEKSQARIAELERQLQEKLKAAEMAAGGATGEQMAAAPAAEAPAQAEQPPAAPVQAPPQGLVASLAQQAKDAFASLFETLKNLSDESWRIIGGAGAVIIGLMLISRIRRRKDEDADEAQTASFHFDENSAPDVADIATQSMAEQDDDIDELEEELHGSSLFDLSDESFMASEAIQDDSSLFAMDEELDSLANVDTADVASQSTMTQMVDVDPVAEADVYLAYDRTEQAIEVLEQSLAKNPNQGAVVIKLLGLYQGNENIEAFSKLFESAAEHIDDEEEWNKIKAMAQNFVPGHELLADDFDSSIPVLHEVVNDEQPEAEAAAEPEPEGMQEQAFTEDEDSNTFDSLASLELELESQAEGAPVDKETMPELPEEALAQSEEVLELVEDLPAGEQPEQDSSTALDEELDTATQEVNQHEPDTALALAKAYIELGEENIAKDFLQDVINGDSAELKAEAEQMLASLG